MVRIVQKLRLFLFVVAILVGMPAHAATLPAGYTELEYIESTGTQYIDTGVSLHSNNVVYDFTVIDNEKTTNKSLFGSQTPYSGILNSFGGNVTTKRLFAGSTSGTNIGYTVSENKKHHILTLNNGSAELKTDGVVIGTATYSGTVVNNKDIYLFANNGASSSQYSSYKLFHFAIYDNNILVRNFIPAQQGTTVGLYDTVSGQFFTNAGTGEFVAGLPVSIKIATTKYNEQQFAPVQNRLSDAMDAVDTVVTQTMSQAQAIDTIATSKQTRPDEGCSAKYCLLVEDEDGTPHWYPIAGANGVAHNLPAGYTELQYTYMTSGSYLLTDIVPTYDGKVVFEFTTTTPPVSGAYFLGGRTATYGGLFFGKSSGGVFIVDAFGSASNDRYTSSVIPTDNTRYKFTFDNKVATLESGGSTLFTETFTGANANGANLAINTLNNNGTTMGYSDGIYVHSLKVWNAQGELVANYIPAKQNNPLTVGFYDTVSETFKTATAGTFTAGPDM